MPYFLQIQSAREEKKEIGYLHHHDELGYGLINDIYGAVKFQSIDEIKTFLGKSNVIFYTDGGPYVALNIVEAELIEKQNISIHDIDLNLYAKKTNEKDDTLMYQAPYFAFGYGRCDLCDKEDYVKIYLTNEQQEEKICDTCYHNVLLQMTS